MKIKNILMMLMLSLALSGFAMTDEQVIDYIKQQSAAGKSQQQIGRELVAKGVTPAQAQRIKAMFESSQGSQTNIMNQTVEGANMDRRHSATNDLTAGSFDEIDRQINMVMVEKEDTVGRRIYGHNIFNTQGLTFQPNENLATPQNYTLGPGDEVIIDIWGANEDHIRQAISPEGSIMISQIGPVYLNGMSLNQANNHIKSVFSQKYGGVNEEETDIQLTLGQVRSIQVDVMGEVSTPGTFQISPFSSVFHALYRAGGINDIGSLRNIQVLRNGRKVAGLDMYEYLFEGKTSGNIKLQEGDVIIVPPYEQLVNIDGNVKRPMYYEIKPNETIEDILNFAGGFTGDAYSDMVRVSRQAGNENELYNVESGEFNTYRLQDGDLITVGTILDRFSNRVELKGSVFRPGMYAINPNMQTVSQLINTANGLTEDAYTDRVLLYREGPNLELQVLSFDLGEIMAGLAPDIELQKNDMLVISSIHELEARGELTIEGQIANPGTYPYAENMSLEDLILAAGGLLEGASSAKVDIARRIVDPASTEQTNQLAEIFTVNIEKGLKKGAGDNFELKPFDLVTVRKSPGYSDQQTVTVDGQVLFDGTYVLQKRNERISDIINRAGGILDAGYIKGAHLQRQLTEDEYEARRETLRLAMAQSESGRDSISLSKIEVSKTYNVGINLEMALQNPGSTYDLVLEPGDRLTIPQLQSTVKISGDVMFPNSVVYEPDKKLKYYIEQAGGYGQQAKKNKVFVVYLNGTVAVGKRNVEIQPGCHIIVPSKPENSGVNWTRVMALATSFTSVASLAATIVSLVKR